MSPRDPGETFLGVSMSGDPFAMLGLPRERADDATVLQALGKRMSEIARHARSQTPEANEIRLALHAAAAQLLDPQLQDLLLSQPATRPLAPPSPLISAAPAPVHPETPAESEPHPLMHDVLLVVAASGGWNGRAMRRLAMLAHARGIPSAEIPEAVTTVLASPIRAVESASIDEPGEDTSPRVGSIAVGAGVSSTHRASLGVRAAPWLIGLLTVVSLYFVWTRLTHTPPTPRVPTDPLVDIPSPTTSPAPSSPTLSQAGATPEIPAPLDARSAAREIVRLSTLREAFDDARLEAFAGHHRQIATRWTELSVDQIGAVHNAILEMLYRLANDSPRSQAIIAAIGEPLRGTPASADDLRSWTWSVGTLSRLSMERNLPTAVDSAIIGRLAGALGEDVRAGSLSFSDAARASLTRSAAQLAAAPTSEAIWHAWLDQLGALAAADETAYTQSVLSALETLMVVGEDPSQSRTTFQAIELLSSALRLEPGSPVAERVVAWHADDRISIADLTVMMRSLVARSRHEGIDESLVLSVGAGVAERMTARATLESVLLGRDSGAAESVAAWAGIADQQLARVPGTRPVELVGRALIMSRLAEAARATLWGDAQQAETVLANLTSDLDQMIAGIGDGSNDYLGGDNASEWAIKYIDAKQNIPVRQALLAELTRGNRTLGPVAAEVIVRDAFLGTPASVRAQAREIVLLYASSPSILNAVLEYLPRVPKVDSNSQLIESVALTRLPAATSPNWSLRARRAIVDELLRRIAGVGEGQVIDQLVAELRSSYEARLARPSSPQNTAADALQLAEAAEALAAQWRELAQQEIEDLSLLSHLDDLDQRSIGRLLLAEGSLDRFAAHQSASVEAMALLVMAENPGVRSQAEAVVAELTKRRREARNILEQIVASEEAAVKLWKLRLERSVS